MAGNYRYDVAQICLNGHLITSMAKSNPEFTQKYYDKCGAETISSCPYCEEFIRGNYIVWRVAYIGGYKIPKYCHNCGKPYPWTESKIKAAKELVNEIKELSSEEKNILKQSIDDLIKEVPREELAALRFKKLIVKGGKEVVQAMRDLLVDLLSEIAKKTIINDP